MNKEKCAICSKTIGKRICELYENKLICTKCCEKIKTSICMGCIHYNKSDKSTKINSDNIEIIDPELDKKIDHAFTLLKKGDIISGERMMSSLFQEQPDIDSVQLGMGIIYLMKEQFDEALDFFDNAISINPDFPEAWFNKAVAHKNKLELGETLRAFQKVIETGDPSEPYMPQAKNFIQDLEKRIHAETGLSLDQYLQTEEIFNAAFSELHKGEWKRALVGFNKVLAKNPKHIQSYGNIGLCYAKLGKKRKH